MNDFEKKKTHPSYGIISFSRSTSSNKHPLFGSSIKHGDTITMRLSHARLERGLNQDWCYPQGLITEIEMSGSQFAELITSLNQGDGVPCTIRWLNGNIERPPVEDKTDQHRKEFAAHQDNTLAMMKKTIDMITKLFDKKSLTKAEKELVLKELKTLTMNVGENSTFQISQFDEQMAKTVTEAKAEIENFIQNRMIMIANNNLVENQDIKNPIELIDSLSKTNMKQLSDTRDTIIDSLKATAYDKDFYISDGDIDLCMQEIDMSSWKTSDYLCFINFYIEYSNAHCCETADIIKAFKELNK